MFLIIIKLISLLTFTSLCQSTPFGRSVIAQYAPKTKLMVPCNNDTDCPTLHVCYKRFCILEHSNSVIKSLTISTSSSSTFVTEDNSNLWPIIIVLPSFVLITVIIICIVYCISACKFSREARRLRNQAHTISCITNPQHFTNGVYYNFDVEQKPPTYLEIQSEQKNDLPGYETYIRRNSGVGVV